jgi:hypothetical protein
MKIDKNMKNVLLAGGIFTIAVGADIASKAIYSRTKIGPDRKSFILASAISISTLYLMFRVLKYEGGM